MKKHCESCGMPLEKKEDFAKGDENFKFCLYCVNEEGNVKSCEDIFESGVQFFMSQIGDNREMVEKVTRKNMNGLPYWQNNEGEILKGEMATDEEFAEALKKLS